jgi:hypothetical protein
MKIRPIRAKILHADVEMVRRTDMTKLKQLYPILRTVLKKKLMMIQIHSVCTLTPCSRYSSSHVKSIHMMFTAVLSFLKFYTHTGDGAAERKRLLKAFCYTINIQLISNQPKKFKYEYKVKINFTL